MLLKEPNAQTEVVSHSAFGRYLRYCSLYLFILSFFFPLFSVPEETNPTEPQISACEIKT